MVLAILLPEASLERPPAFLRFSEDLKMSLMISEVIFKGLRWPSEG